MADKKVLRQTLKSTLSTITKSSFGDTFAFCNLCRSDISISHGGHDDLRKHCATQNHFNAESVMKSQPSLLAFAGADRLAEVTCSAMTFLPLNSHFISNAINRQCIFCLCLVTFVIDCPEACVKGRLHSKLALDFFAGLKVGIFGKIFTMKTISIDAVVN